MPTGREQIKLALSHSREKPVRALGRSALVGLLVTLIIVAVQAFLGFFLSASPGAYHLMGSTVSLMLWGADRVWFSMAAPMFHRPFSIPAYLSRIPFLFIAGGIAFEAAVLTSRSLGWLASYEIPVKDIFDFGATIGVLSACILQGVLYRSVHQTIRGSESPGSHHDS